MTGNMPMMGAPQAMPIQSPNQQQPGAVTPDQMQALSQQLGNPGLGNNSPSPVSQADLDNIPNQYASMRQKISTDSDTRKRNLFASNIEKTLQMIKPEDLAQYSGAKGQAALLYDKLASSAGEAPQRYINYSTAAQNADMLATQVRQFYGDSVQPAVQEKLASITNPASWKNDPNVTLAKYNELKKLLGNEIGTYRSALLNTSPYREPAQSQGSQNTNQMTKSVGGKTYVKVGNDWYEQ